MNKFNLDDLQKLYIPAPGSHKGQNGKLMVIGGSHLFHAASLWALEVASKIVDMVFYSSVPENNEIVLRAKEGFRNGIVVRRESLEDYIKEADCILIGPGMVRSESELRTMNHEPRTIEEINTIEDEGLQTRYLTKYLLTKYPHKRWVIDAGALQMMDAEWLEGLKGNVVLTPHPKEMERLFKNVIPNLFRDPQQGNEEMLKQVQHDKVGELAKKYNCTILLKGEKDIVCGPFDSAQGKNVCVEISGGNAGMTKGGTGDVLAGLVAALACKNDLFLAATAGSYINKKAGESLFERVGYFFNASDLVDEIPVIMNQLINK